MCVSSKGLALRMPIATVKTVVGMVEQVKFPNTKPDILRCQDLDDNKEVVHHGGSSKGGQCSGSLFYDPADTVHKRFVALVHSNDYTTAGLKPEERKFEWDLQFNQYTVPKLWKFIGVASQFDITAAVATPLKSDFAIEVEESTEFPN
jgi:hypothetical protein